MKRHWVIALAALAALPCVARAQGDPVWGPTLRITPYIGVSPGITQSGRALVFVNGNTDRRDYELEYSSSLPLGVNIEYRLWNRFSAVVGGAWARRSSGRLLDFTDELVYTTDGTNLLMAKAGLAMRLRESASEMQLRRLNASLSLAPAVIFDKPATDAFSPPAATKTVRSWGVNLGADAELPLANNRLAFSAGVDDWIMLWNKDDYRFRVEPYVQASNPGAVLVVDPDKTHMVVARVGLTWRF